MTRDEVSGWVHWAEARGLVRLKDGREGRLEYFSQGGGKHKVQIFGRHIRVDNDALDCAVGQLEVSA
jgi:hypothetical protein